MITWLGCDAVTGKIVEELPDITVSGTIGSLLAAYTSASPNLPIPLAGYGAPPRNWLAACEPGRSMIVAVLNGVPVWAGIVLVREGGTDVILAVACVSIEGYLDRRFVADHTWVGQDEASVIATGLIGDANTVEGIGLTVDAPATGTLRDRTYHDQDDKSVYSALRELTGVDGGPEWTVVLGWTDSTQTAISKTVRVRKRIGFAKPVSSPVTGTGGVPAVFSTLGDNNATYRYTEDYSAGKGANDVMAVSSGEGTTRPQSTHARDTAGLAAGWPRWEHRYTPSTSITVTSTLDAHATSSLALMRNGSRVLTVTARADAYPMLGVDWSTGDDVGYELIGHRHPDGLIGVARAIGWTIDPSAGTVSPILLIAEVS